jgi:phosphatidylglycerophosphate synthase
MTKYELVDRRPIKSRDTWIAEVLADRLARTGVSPNAISVVGVIVAVCAGIAFSLTTEAVGPANRALWLIGAVFCQVRLLCNLFDGMVAVKRSIASPAGELYNEVPDRISDAVVFIGLGIAGKVLNLGLFAALISVFIAYVRAQSKAAGAPNDFCGPMAKPHRMALVTLLSIFLAISPKANFLVDVNEVALALWIVIVLGSCTAVRRLVRAANYLRGVTT